MRMENYRAKLRAFGHHLLVARKDPTAAQENRLSRKLKQLEKSGEIMDSLYNRLGYLADTHPEFMASAKSTKLRSHSDPLFHA